MKTEDLTAPNLRASEKVKTIEILDLSKTITGKHRTSARELVSQLDKLSKEVELKVTTIIQEQINDPVLTVVRQWIKRAYTEITPVTTLERPHALLSRVR